MSERACLVCGGRSFRTLGDKDGYTLARCRGCALERFDPPPTDEVLAKVYGEHYYDAWGLREELDLVASLKRATFAHVIDGLDRPAPDAKLLDCGAATGFLLEAARARGFDSYGVELSTFGAREIARKFGEDHVFAGELEAARFPSDGGTSGFAAITMCDYLEHVRDPRAVLRRALALLAPGGQIAITTPRTGSLSHRALGLTWPHYKVEHLFYFGAANLTQLLRDVGFVAIRRGRPWKTMNLRYIAHQFATYRHPLLTPLVRSGLRAAPPSLAARPFRVLMGELLLYARKR